jgi:hypothetical protein
MKAAAIKQIHHGMRPGVMLSYRCIEHAIIGATSL